MIDIFVYPVSAIMKFWHLLASTCMDNSAAWLVSIVLLVLTVRGLIAPLNWMSVKAGRLGALMRPENTVLNEQLNNATSQEEAEDALRAQHELKERFGYSAAAGCLPIFIILPFFIGLYQVVLRMARRTDLDHVGALGAADIAQFRAATVNDVSIVALARDHVDLVRPILLAALVFTVLNTIASLYRSYHTMQFDNTAQRRMFWLMCIMVVFVPWVLWHAAMSTLVPVAIIIYWGCTYLFTLVQTLVYGYILRKRYPLPEEVHQMRRDSIASWRRPRRVRRAEKLEAARAKRALGPEQRRAHAKMLADARRAVMAERKAAREQSK